MYYRKALELQAFLDMAKDEGDSSSFNVSLSCIVLCNCLVNKITGIYLLYESVILAVFEMFRFDGRLQSH